MGGFSFSLQGQAEKAPFSEPIIAAPTVPNTPNLPPGTMAMWDLRFDYNISEDSGLASLAGGVHIGNEFWVSVWNSDTLARFDNDGNFIEKFSLPTLFDTGTGGVRGMTWDGTNIWAANNTNTIYQIDVVTKEIVSQVVISTPESARYISFDETADGGNGGFWVGNFNTDINLIDLNGNIITTIFESTHTLGGMYGLAVDNDSEGGPYLWIFHQPGTPTNSLISQVNKTTGVPTGIARDVNLDLAGTEALAGGLFISKDWDPNGGMILGGVNQDGPDRLFGYDLDFVLTENIDLQTANLMSPQTGCDLSDAEVVTFNIVNAGDTEQSMIPLELLLNGMSMGLDTFVGTLAPGETTAFTFASTLDLSIPGNYVIGIRTSEPTDVNNSNDLTNWSIGSKALSAPPFAIDFNAYPLGTTSFIGLYNIGDIPFEVNSFDTPSNNTGPSDDASGGGNYIYMEATNQLPGTTAILTTDCIDLNGNYAEIKGSLAYHMFGAAIGNLVVEVVVTDEGIINTESIIAGSQQTSSQDPWQTLNIDLTSYIGSIIEINIYANIADNGEAAFQADVALDDFIFVACPAFDVADDIINDIDGAGSGAINLTAGGGLPPITYAWSNGESTEDIDGLTADLYTVTITYATGCSIINEYAVEDVCAGFSIDGVVTNVNGMDNGAIDLMLNNGNMPFTYSWSNGADTEDLSGLSNDTYTVSITDNLGCFRSMEFVVDDMTSTSVVDGLTSLELAPNPSQGLVNIHLELAETKDVQIILYDLTGRVILSTPNEMVNSKHFKLDLNSFSNGIYLAQLNIEGQKVSRRIILNR